MSSKSWRDARRLLPGDATAPRGRTPFEDGVGQPRGRAPRRGRGGRRFGRGNTCGRPPLVQRNTTAARSSAAGPVRRPRFPMRRRSPSAPPASWPCRQATTRRRSSSPDLASPGPANRPLPKPSTAGRALATTEWFAGAMARAYEDGLQLVGGGIGARQRLRSRVGTGDPWPVRRCGGARHGARDRAPAPAVLKATLANPALDAWVDCTLAPGRVRRPATRSGAFAAWSCERRRRRAPWPARLVGDVIATMSLATVALDRQSPVAPDGAACRDAIFAAAHGALVAPHLRCAGSSRWPPTGWAPDGAGRGADRLSRRLRVTSWTNTPRRRAEAASRPGRAA